MITVDFDHVRPESSTDWWTENFSEGDRQEAYSFFCQQVEQMSISPNRRCLVGAALTLFDPGNGLRLTFTID